MKNETHCLLLTSPFRPNIGGVETHLDDLIVAGAKRDITFTVITYQPLVTKAKGELHEKGKRCNIYRIPWPRLNLFLILEKIPALEFLYLFPGLFLGGLVYLLFHKNTVTVIHAQGLAAGVAGIILGKFFKKRIIVSTHSIYNFPSGGLYRQFVHYLFINCDKILTLSMQSRDEIVSLGIPKEKVSVFTYWVDQNVFSSGDKSLAREKTDIPKDAFVCLFVGRLVPVKGIHELLGALEKTKDVIGVIVGDGPLKNEVEKAAHGNPNIIFADKLINSELPLYYQASDVLIVPSTHEEGFGRVILEALSCSLPVIGSRRGAIPEALTEEVGILIDISEVSIKNTLMRLVKDKQKIVTLARNARIFAEKKYSSKNAAAILDTYI